MRYRYLLLMAVLLPSIVRGQIADPDPRIYDLSWGERIALRTNGFDWLTLTPNIGAEVDIQGKNYSQWTLGMDIKWKPVFKEEIKPSFVYGRFGIRVDARNYWRTRTIEPDVPKHTRFIDKVFSKRRTLPGKHPLTTFYRGAYFSYNAYNVKFGKNGFQGKALSLGVQYGIVRPLFIYTNGNSLDLDLGFSVGFVATSYDRYQLYEETNKYVVKAHQGMKFIPYPLPTELRVGVIYRFGHKEKDGDVKNQLTRRFHHRWDIDGVYRDSIINARQAAAKRKSDIKDSIARAQDSIWFYTPTAVYMTQIESMLALPEFADTTSAQVVLLKYAKHQAERDLKDEYMIGDSIIRVNNRMAIMKFLDYFMTEAKRRAGVTNLVFDDKGKVIIPKEKKSKKEAKKNEEE